MEVSRIYQDHKEKGLLHLFSFFPASKQVWEFKERKTTNEIHTINIFSWENWLFLILKNFKTINSRALELNTVGGKQNLYSTYIILTPPKVRNKTFMAKYQICWKKIYSALCRLNADFNFYKVDFNVHILWGCTYECDYFVRSQCNGVMHPWM